MAVALGADHLCRCIILKPRKSGVRSRAGVRAVRVGGRELLQSGSVRAIPPKEAASNIREEGFQLLDVRPTWEREKARVAGSLHVPLFVEDTDASPITLVKKWVHFGYIGLWTGQKLTTINDQFLLQVRTLVPDQDSKLLLACGEGLRSLMAVARLHEGGYKNLGWLAGGFNVAKDNDFPTTEGTTKLQYATIGGASYYFLQLLLLLRAVDEGSKKKKAQGVMKSQHLGLKGKCQLA
ncbi:Rhodanese-like domain-containing protein 10 [Asimina triloba]